MFKKKDKKVKVEKVVEKDLSVCAGCGAVATIVSPKGEGFCSLACQTNHESPQQ